MQPMRAVIQREFGGPDVLVVEHVDVPEPVPTEVQVRVHFAGVNPVDAKVRSGASIAEAMGRLPLRVGWDVAGVVTKLGVGVTRFAVGDRVYGMPHFPRTCGAYAEYITAPARQLVIVPDGLELARAAAVPLPATTAYQIVVDVARVRAGQLVLVLGAGGAVGRFAVQLAKHRGATVIGSADPTRLPDLMRLGLDHGIDNRTQRFENHVRGADLVIDLVGGEHSRRAIAVTAPGGLIVSVPSGGDDGLEGVAAASGIRVTGMIVEPDRVALQAVSSLIAAGTVSVPRPSERRLEDVVAVHHDLTRRSGKMVLEVSSLHRS